MIRVVLRAFKDRRYVPGGTGVIFDATLFDSEVSYTDEQRKQIVTIMVANGIVRSALIVGDPVRCEAGERYKEFLAQFNIQHGVFCKFEDAKEWIQGGDPWECRFSRCTSGRMDGTVCLCKGREPSIRARVYPERMSSI
jgi:hypothetical protein